MRRRFSDTFGLGQNREKKNRDWRRREEDVAGIEATEFLKLPAEEQMYISEIVMIEFLTEMCRYLE